MTEISGLGAFGVHPIPNDDILKQVRLGHIKTKAGKMAYLLLHGSDADLGGIVNGISKAEGAIKWISRILKERTA